MNAPEGYVIIKNGMVQQGDLVWNPVRQVWIETDCVGHYVTNMYAVARKGKMINVEIPCGYEVLDDLLN